MSRSGYNEDCSGWDLIRWRGAVEAAIRGRRGQAFLREMVAAFDALPEKRLISDELVTPAGEVCAMGAVCVKRGLDMTGIDPYDRRTVAGKLGIAPSLAAEIAFVNDEQWGVRTPEDRFKAVRSWVEKQITQNSSP